MAASLKDAASALGHTLLFHVVRLNTVIRRRANLKTAARITNMERSLTKHLRLVFL